MWDGGVVRAARVLPGYPSLISLSRISLLFLHCAGVNGPAQYDARGEKALASDAACIAKSSSSALVAPPSENSAHDALEWAGPTARGRAPLARLFLSITVALENGLFHRSIGSVDLVDQFSCLRCHSL